MSNSNSRLENTGVNSKKQSMTDPCKLSGVLGVVFGAVVDVFDAVVDVFDAVVDVSDAVVDVFDAVVDVFDAVVDVFDAVVDVFDAAFGVLDAAFDFDATGHVRQPRSFPCPMDGPNVPIGQGVGPTSFCPTGQMCPTGHMMQDALAWLLPIKISSCL